MHEVMDGLWPVTFEGTQLAAAATERDMPPGAHWEDLDEYTKKAVSRWVRMALYKVEPGQDDPMGRIRLPGGGYFFHIVGESLIYHVQDSACNAGVPVRANGTGPDVLPCWKCRPPMLWKWDPYADPDADRAALMVPDGDMIVDLESPRHTLRRSETAAGIVERVIDKRMSSPAQRLLEIAREKDPDIEAVFSAAA